MIALAGLNSLQRVPDLECPRNPESNPSRALSYESFSFICYSFPSGRKLRFIFEEGTGNPSVSYYQ